MGWYRALERWLSQSDDLIAGVAFGIVLVTILIFLQPSRTLRVLWLTYLISP